MEVFISKHQKESKEEYWQRHISHCRRSGKSRKEYCRTHGLAESTYGYWKKRLSVTRESRPKFYALAVQQPSAPPINVEKGGGISLFLADNRFRIELAEDFSVTALTQLIVTLEEMR